MILQLSSLDKQTLCTYAREAIVSQMESRQPAYPALSKGCRQHAGAFVTLREQGELRGCIGHMQSQNSLYETIESMARAAAFDDPRFEPLRKSELGLIDIEITVLGPLQRIHDESEIILGVHGVYLIYQGQAGVFLPQVATECGWDTQTFLDQLCRKAGVAPGSWKHPDAELFIFEGLIFGEKES
ncbi:MAG: AmmeMemoRadiSam system protein A [Spirochaetaceae bacterium]|nr:AmmeMemoRadiSam system protein A [Spirochaetaceae bacterium]